MSWTVSKSKREQRQFMYFAMSDFHPSETGVDWIHLVTKEVTHGSAWTYRENHKMLSCIYLKGHKKMLFFSLK